MLIVLLAVAVLGSPGSFHGGAGSDGGPIVISSLATDGDKELAGGIAGPAGDRPRADAGLGLDAAGLPQVEEGGVSEARYALEQIAPQLQIEISNQQAASPSRQIVDIEMRWDGSEFKFSSVYYPVAGTIHALIDVDEAAFTSWASSMGALNGRWLDLEVEPVAGSLRYAGIFYEDGDDYAGTLVINADESLFQAALLSNQRDGLAIIDFESWEDGSGDTRYAGVWVNDPNQPRTHLYYGLEWDDITSTNANSLLNPLHGRIIDLERYRDPWDRTRYAVIVAQHPGGGWGVYRAQSSAQLASNNSAISDDDTHLIDLEAYDSGSGIVYAGIWGDTWKSLNEVPVLPPANLIDRGAEIDAIVANIESPTAGVDPDRIGLFARSVRNNESIGYRQDETFYLASTAKLAIHARLWQLFESGHLDPNDVILYGDPNHPDFNPAFSNNPAPWYVDERPNPGLATLFDPNLPARWDVDTGLPITLAFLDRAMMTQSDNAATSMLVKDSTYGLAWDSLDLNEWLSGLSGVGQGWGVLTSIQDLDALIIWQGQHTDTTRDQISLLRAPRAGLESLWRGAYRFCSNGSTFGGRCGQGTLVCPSGSNCVSIPDPWGDLGAFLIAEGDPTGSPPSPWPSDHERYYNMGLNSATPRALGMLQEKLIDNSLFADPNTTLSAFRAMRAGGALAPGSATTSAPLPGHITWWLTATKGGSKGGTRSPLSWTAIYRIGPDAVVLNILTEFDSRPSTCSQANPICGTLSQTLFSNPPTGLRHIAAAVVQQLTADLVTCALDAASFGPAITWAGRTFDTHCDVRNDGNIDSPAFDVTFVASLDGNIDLNDEIIGTVRVPGVPAGSAAPAHFVGSFPDATRVSGGAYNLGWVIDSDTSYRLDSDGNGSLESSFGEVGEWDETAASNTGFFPGLGLTVVDPPPPPCPDADSDGFAACDPGYLCDPDNVTCGDCDDGRADRNPGATEVCDQVDNDCNGTVDDGAPRLWSMATVEEIDADANDELGTAMGVVGDVDSDGVDDFAVGVWGDRNTNITAGSVKLFSGADRSIICTALDPEPGNYDRLGYSVAGIGDVTGPGGGPRDGIPDFAAGAPYDDHTASDAGSVLIFSGSDCSFARRLLDPAGAALDHLGWSLVSLGNTEGGDGVPDLAVGAPDSDLMDTNAGKVLLFSPVTGSVLSTMTDGAEGEANEGLGTSLAAFGPLVEGNDYTLVVGAPRRNTGGTTDAGVLVLFHALYGTVLDRYTGYSGDSYQELGTSTAAVPDYTGDGVPEIAAGIPGIDTNVGGNRGGVVMLDGGDGSILRFLGDPAGGSNDDLGAAVAWVGQVEGDEPGIAAGAPNADPPAGSGAGRVLVFGAISGTLLGNLTDPAGALNNNLGITVAGLGDLTGDGYGEIAAGTPTADGFEATDAGRVLIFSRQTDCDLDGITPFAGDCGDGEAGVGPGAVEVCDGLDNDCDGDVDEDDDGDGYAVCMDCNDRDPLSYPGATERCNGLDDDCDTSVDEGADADGDGWTEPCDCDDSAEWVNPGAPDLICDQVDQDCSGVPDQGAATPGVARVLVDPDGRLNDELGTSLAAIGDVTGDGVSDLAAGIPFDDDTQFQGGRVAIFDGATGALSCFLEDNPGSYLAQLGTTVAGVADLSGDGVPDIVAGGPGYTMAISDSGAVLVFSGADCSLLMTAFDPDAGSGDRLGVSVAGLGDLNGDGVPEFAGGTTRADPMGVNGSGKVVVFNGADGLVLYELINEHPRASDEFGTAIVSAGDVDGDGVDDIAVGAAQDSTSVGSQGGTVSIFSGVDGSFLRKLRDDAGSNGDKLGTALARLVDLDGDGVPELAAGAPYDDDGGANAGAVLIFSGRTGATLRKISGSGPGTNEYLGSSLALLPDINGDGVDDLAAGAPGDDTAGTNKGSVFLLSGTDGTLLRRLTDSGPGINEDLGRSVAVPGDVTGDGVPEVAAGVPLRDGPEDADAGAVLLFTFESDCDGDGTGPFTGDCDESFADVHAGAPEVCDGRDNDCDLAVDEDEDGDGFDVCSDCDPANPRTHPGATEICNGVDDNCVGGVDETGPDLDGDGFAGPCGDCDESAFAVNPGASESCNGVDDNCDGLVDEGFSMPEASAQILDPQGAGSYRMGQALAAVGDIDGDGSGDLLVGVPGDGTVGNSGGAALVISGSSLASICRLISPTGERVDELGQAVAGGADMTGDGVPDLVVAAPWEDTQAYAAGEVILFSGADCQQVREMWDPEGGASDYLGSTLAVVDDLNGDSVADIAAGSPRDDLADENDAGSLLIFSGADGSVVRKIPNPDARGGDRFGHAVIGLEDVDADGVSDLAVAAIEDDTLNGNNSGSISVISGATGASLRTLVIPGGTSNAYLGTALARVADLDGDGYDDILAGAPQVDNPVSNAGVVVALSPATGALIRIYVDPLGAAGRELGTTVAAVPDMDGDGVMEVLAGAPLGDTMGTNAGEAVLFSGATGAVLQRLTDPFAAAGDSFAQALTVLMDVTGGGLPELVVAAPLANTAAGSDAGALTIFSLEADCDGDGLGPLLDCDDGDPTGAGLPGPAEAVAFSDSVTMFWSPPGSHGSDPDALFYDVIRSSAAGDFLTMAVCAEADDGGDTLASIPGAPAAAGQVWYFLVRSQNRCGSGGCGSDSSDAARSVRACP